MAEIKGDDMTLHVAQNVSVIQGPHKPARPTHPNREEQSRPADRVAKSPIHLRSLVRDRKPVYKLARSAATGNPLPLPLPQQQDRAMFSWFLWQTPLHPMLATVQEESSLAYY